MIRQKRFTLVELLVVVAIIGILSGLVLNGVQNGIIAGYRTQSNQALRQIVLSILSNETGNRRMTFSDTYAVENGISTVTIPEMAEGNVIVAGNLEFPETYDYDIFEQYAGRHPFNAESGRYVFMGLTSGGNLKNKNDSKVRIAMELYDWTNEGDHRVGVAFADGRVVELKVTTPYGEIDVAEVLSTLGENEGKL